jgi:hypothetical protein
MKTPAWRYVGTADSERFRLLANPRPRSELIAALSLAISGLSSLLVAWAVTNAAGGEAQRLHASLAQPSAKMWLAEYPSLCRLCAPEWSSSYTPDLRIEKLALGALDACSFFLGYSSAAVHEDSRLRWLH